MLKVEDVMVDKVVTIDASKNARDAVNLMNKHEIGCLVVTMKSKPVGIVTERDFLKRILAKSKNPEAVKIREIMSAPLRTAEPDMDVEDVTKFMFRMNIKKLPVIQGRKLIGLVTFTDLVRFQPQIVKILKKISELGPPPRPKRMKKVIDYYVA
jgi:CBS-domain-containing membrane protein